MMVALFACAGEPTESPVVIVEVVATVDCCMLPEDDDLIVLKTPLAVIVVDEAEGRDVLEGDEADDCDAVVGEKAEDCAEADVVEHTETEGLELWVDVEVT